MAQKRRFLDVWIVESNTVYREVPYEVVTDWVQQGRLLEDDRLRPSGTAEWFRVGASPEFKPYLPKPEPMRADDQAEALEPVELEFRYKKRHDEEDDDVDMIPLIDISLVLLIFFMMTPVAGGAMFLPTPQAPHGDITSNPEEIVLGIGMEGTGDNAIPYYMLWVGSNAPEKSESHMATQAELLDRLRDKLKTKTGRTKISINAVPDARAGWVRELMRELETDATFRQYIEQKFIGVSEKPG
jgi:biopolymer transport protein ExbD